MASLRGACRDIVRRRTKAPAQRRPRTRSPTELARPPGAACHRCRMKKDFEREWCGRSLPLRSRSTVRRRPIHSRPRRRVADRPAVVRSLHADGPTPSRHPLPRRRSCPNQLRHSADRGRPRRPRAAMIPPADAPPAERQADSRRSDDTWLEPVELTDEVSQARCSRRCALVTHRPDIRGGAGRQWCSRTGLPRATRQIAVHRPGR